MAAWGVPGVNILAEYSSKMNFVERGCRNEGHRMEHLTNLEKWIWMNRKSHSDFAGRIGVKQYKTALD